MGSTVPVTGENRTHGYGAEMMPRPAAVLDAAPRPVSAAVTVTRGHGLDWRWPPVSEMPTTYLRSGLATSIVLSLR